MHNNPSYQIGLLSGATFGVELIPNVRVQALVTDLEHDSKPVLDAFYETHGLMGDLDFANSTSTIKI